MILILAVYFDKSGRIMENTLLERANSAYMAHLERTLRQLHDRVKEQEAALEKVSAAWLRLLDCI